MEQPKKTTLGSIFTGFTETVGSFVKGVEKNIEKHLPEEEDEEEEEEEEDDEVEWKTEVIYPDPDYCAKRIDTENEKNFYYVIKPGTPMHAFIMSYEGLLNANNRETEDLISMLKPEDEDSDYSDEEEEEDPAIYKKIDKEEETIPLRNFKLEQKEQDQFLRINEKYDNFVVRLYDYKTWVNYSEVNMLLLMQRLLLDDTFCPKCSPIVKKMTNCAEMSQLCLKYQQELKSHKERIVNELIMTEIEFDKVYKGMTVKEFIRQRRSELLNLGKRIDL